MVLCALYYITPPTGPVFLKTASTRIWHHCTTIAVNILLDEGAQRSFITDNVSTQLQIDRKGCTTEPINIDIFGESETHYKHLDVTQIQLETRGTLLEMSTLTVPKISTPVKNYVYDSVCNYKYLQGLPLAHHMEKDVFEIDLLIGADYYWIIAEGNIVRGPGPTAVASKLLSGPTNLKNASVMTTLQKSHLLPMLTSNINYVTTEILKPWVGYHR